MRFCARCCEVQLPLLRPRYESIAPPRGGFAARQKKDTTSPPVPNPVPPEVHSSLLIVIVQSSRAHMSATYCCTSWLQQRIHDIESKMRISMAVPTTRMPPGICRASTNAEHRV